MSLEASTHLICSPLSQYLIVFLLVAQQRIAIGEFMLCIIISV